MGDTLEQAAVRVGGIEIPPARIAEEAQNHPAGDAQGAWTAAAQALAVRQMLLDEADRQGVVAVNTTDAKGAVLSEDDARIDALIEREVQAPQATSQEARRFYENHLDRFRSETLIEAEHILFSASPDDQLAYGLATGDARTLIRRLQDEPASFAKLAREFSACPSKEQGGNLGQIGPGQTVREFEDALFALGEGELAPNPVRSPFGVHVIRAGRRVEGKQLPFEVVEASIRNYLEEASYRRAMAQYLSILASQADIEGVDLPVSEGFLVQ